MLGLIQRDCCATEAIAAAERDEALGYVVRGLIEGARERCTHAGRVPSGVAVPVYRKAGMDHLVLTLEEMDLNGHDKLDAIVEAKLKMLDVSIEEWETETASETEGD